MVAWTTRSVLHASWDAGLLLDSQGRVVEMNAAAQDLFRSSRSSHSSSSSSSQNNTPHTIVDTPARNSSHRASPQHISNFVELHAHTNAHRNTYNYNKKRVQSRWDQVLSSIPSDISSNVGGSSSKTTPPPPVMRYPNGAAVVHRGTVSAKISITSVQDDQDPAGGVGKHEPAFCMFVQVDHHDDDDANDPTSSSTSSTTTTATKSMSEQSVKFSKPHQQVMETVRDQQSLARGLIDSSFDAMFLIDHDGLIQMVNKAATDVFGWTEAEFLGKKINMIMPQHHAEHHDKYIQNYQQTGLKMVMGRKRNLTAVKKDGTEFPIQLGVQESKLSKSGKTYYCGYVRDRSEVAHKSEMLQTMIDSSFDAMFQINERGVIELVNKAALEVFGYDKESDFVGKNISMIMNDQDAHHHNLYMSSYMKSGTSRVIGKKRRFTAVKKDGTKFPIQLGVKEAQTPSGERFFCGFVQDNTREMEEEEKTTRHKQLTNGMINAAFDAIFQIDSKGIIQMVNQAAIDHFGFSREEFLGSNIAMITGPDHCDRHNAYMAQYLQSGERRVIGRRRQLTAYRKDGSSFPIELGVNEIKTVWGEKVFAGFIRDISRQKFDEDNIQEHEKLTDGIFDAMLDPLLTIDEHLTIYTANACE
mmetsp:Transcript_5974/g.16732  ORF Transcript_5974/g.16732 Transcript_5974/m.16732 type:complete len:641 (-) Transcript_5974:1545-3467(-)